MNLTFEEYQRQAISTAVYPICLVASEAREENIRAGYLYPALGLVGEAGEVAEKIKKAVRDNDGEISEEKRIEIGKEISDVLWYCAALAQELRLNLGVIAQANLDKLASRKARGTLNGSGDNR